MHFSLSLFMAKSLTSLLSHVRLQQGNYAFAVTWSDGHTSSLYTYDHITKIIDEEAAAAATAATATAATAPSSREQQESLVKHHSHSH